ncbi:MAG: class I SAM-dependent methyltransferase [Nocardioides sp.]
MDSTRSGTAVVVGRTLDDGARRYAEDLDDYVSTSYEELASVIAGIRPSFIGITAGSGMTQAVAAALEARAEDPDLLVAVELPESGRTSDAVVETLAAVRHPVIGVRHFRDRPCLLIGGDGAVAGTDDAILPAVFAPAVRGRTREKRLVSPWEVDAARARSLELEQELDETSKRLWAARAEIRKLKSKPARRRLSDRVQAAVGDSSRKRDRPQRSEPLPMRAARAASGVLGAESRRSRALTLLAELTVVAVLLVGLPVLLGVLAGAEAAVLGLALAGILVVLGALAGLLIRVTRLVAAGEGRGETVRSDLRLLLEQGEELRTSSLVAETMLRRHGRALQALPGTEPATPAQVEASAEALGERVQAMINLFDMVHVSAAVPAMSHWAASPDLVLWTVDTFLKDRPSLVVECGSGVSTLFLALAAKQYDLPTRIVALEHDRTYARRTREMLAHHGVAGFAEVRHAPLARTHLEDHETPWYDESALTDLKGIGLLLVDGPPARTGPAARFPAIPILKDGLADTCTILVDDLIREEDREVSERWRSLLPDFSYEVLALHKGAAVLRRRGATA